MPTLMILESAPSYPKINSSSSPKMSLATNDAVKWNTTPPRRRYAQGNTKSIPPCQILSSNELGAEEGYGGDEDSGWVDTHHFTTGNEGSTKTVDLGSQEAAASNEPEDEDAVMDLDDFAESGELDNIDPSRSDCPVSLSFHFLSRFVVRKEEYKAEVERPRTYDLHICYDKYYQVPRLYLMGYDENRKPLTIDQMYEDFSAVGHLPCRLKDWFRTTPTRRSPSRHTPPWPATCPPSTPVATQRCPRSPLF